MAAADHKAEAAVTFTVLIVPPVAEAKRCGPLNCTHKIIAPSPAQATLAAREQHARWCERVAGGGL
jgi:hypothetical protein